MRVRLVVASVIAVATVGGIVSAATSTVRDPATVGQVAERVSLDQSTAANVAVAFDIGDVDQFVIDASAEAARRSGGGWSTRRTGSVGLSRITRGRGVVHGAPSGYFIPLVFTATPAAATRGVYGAEVAAVANAGDAVLNQITATATGARVGDVLEVRNNAGATSRIRIGMIAPHDDLGGTELVVDTSIATALGFTSDGSVVMWGMQRGAFEAAISDLGLLGRRDTRVAMSWEPPNPDSTLSTAEVKARLGEPWYRVNSNGTISMHPTWESTTLTPGRVLLNGAIPIRARCDIRVAENLKAALAEVAAAGLGAAIDVANANTYGGCFNPRYSRGSGFLSRHAYGIALDTNTVTNCMGCRPQMHCEVVRIFRRHGFAWGGNFRRPDGMHFEWVGERRDQLSYPSAYCPNPIGRPTQSVSPPIGLEVLAYGMPDHMLIDGHTHSGHDDEPHTGAPTTTVPG